MIYLAVFEKGDDGSVCAYVPDLPGCISWGATLDEAQQQVAEAAALWLEASREKGESPPPATTITALAIEAA